MTPLLGPSDPRGEPMRRLQVGPDPAEDAPAFVADRVLTPLLLEDGVPWVLPPAEKAPVLDPPIELADESLLFPGEVTAPHEPAGGCAHPQPQRPGRQIPPGQDHPAARLPDALAAAVGELDG